VALREAPWLLEQAQNRVSSCTAREVLGLNFPGETTPFAKSLGLGTLGPGEQRGRVRPQAGPGIHAAAISLEGL